jgi:hypothetical protein
MVRVCLYLALALGLAGSVDGANCDSFVFPATGYSYSGAAYAAGTSGGRCGAAGAESTAVTTLAEGEWCDIGCAAGYFIGHPQAVVGSTTLAMVICPTIKATVVLPTCTACTAVENRDATANEPTCTSTTNSKVTGCATGYYKKVATTDEPADQCLLPASQKNCDADETTFATTTGFYDCKTPSAGYKLDTNKKPVVCLANTFNIINTDETAEKITGITCKKDGTEIRIPSCPAGSYKVAGTGTANDACTSERNWIVDWLCLSTPSLLRVRLSVRSVCPSI